MKVQLSIGERTINRLLYEPRPKRESGLARDKWAFDILNEAFEEVRKAEREACISLIRKQMERASEHYPTDVHEAVEFELLTLDAAISARSK